MVQTLEYEQIAPSSEEPQESDSAEAQPLDLISMDEAIERLSVGPFQKVMMATLGLFFAADSMQVMLLSILTVVLQDDWELSDEKSALIATSFFFGSLIGNLFLGPLADAIGRRPVFLLASFEVATVGLLTSLSPTFEVLIIMIFLVGIGIGGLTIPFDILAEFIPAEGRGTNLLFINYFWTIGSLFVVVVAFFTLHGSKDRWRVFVAACPFPCFISLVAGYLYIPESARWLLTKGRNAEAMKILREAAKKNGHDVDLVFPSNVALAPEPHHEEATIADLFKPRWLRIILLLWGTWGLSAFGYYGTIMAITNVFAEDSEETDGGGNKDDSSGGDYDFDFGAIFVSSGAELLGTTVAIAAVDRMGRIRSQVVSYLLAGLSVGLLWISAKSPFIPRVVLIAFGFSARIFEMAGTCLTWVTTAEVLTTDVRGAGHSTSSAIGRIGAMWAPSLVEGSMPLRTLGIIMLLTHTLTVWCISHVPETKGRNMGAVPVSDSVDGSSELVLEANESEEDSSSSAHDHLM